ncbi:hypothetical protein DCAR_0313475 [Daucus carota subsp. sativus]|uniref:NB-ARC domain-containing protein n=2 Tax=Daucus carota subsp. sativus TaxID=79200 RepID=A0AAF0WR20_DAUCS|nr:hypothetical protein DCAR_0313475 [Daucus carota subsp. sativus]
MVGLADIPCLGKIVERVSDATVDSLFRGCGYMFCYKDLVKVLDKEIQKLNIQEERVSAKTVEKRADGKIIKGHVLEWQKEVEAIQKNAKEFTEKYKKRSSWREAEHKAKRVTELYDSGKDLLSNEIAYLPPVENLPTTDTMFQDFESRKDAFRKVWEALVTEGSSRILGIYGMPGVGKTRMMEQIWKEAKEKKIFDKVTRADVGNEKLDVIELQKQIASHLDCHYESSDDKKHRANQLKNSIVNGGKILVILDDVWREIPLDDIGIPTDDGCRVNILLTSRKEDACLRNNCKHPVNITTLEVDKAWDLFRNTVGACQIDSLQDESLVKKVCKKCGGLPLLIHAVGKALQFTSHDSWKDALRQLEKGKFENIAGIDSEVYACVKLSIDRLPDDAKSCLFLCSLYREDADIQIKKLIQIATSSLVDDGESRIRAMFNILRSSSLLLDTQEDHVIKLHDLIRDVARSIAARDPKYAFLLVKSSSRLPDTADYCTRKFLHLQLETNICCFPNDLVCQNCKCCG